MFEIILQRALAAIGASDDAIRVMGPTFTMMLAVVGGTAAAQFLKFPLSWWIKSDQRFSWYVRLLAMTATLVFAHVLSDTVPLQLEIFIAICQPLLYHATLAIIRRWWPWMEIKPFVGAVCPPMSAFVANAQRKEDKANDEQSGA